MAASYIFQLPFVYSFLPFLKISFVRPNDSRLDLSANSRARICIFSVLFSLYFPVKLDCVYIGRGFSFLGWYDDAFSSSPSRILFFQKLCILLASTYIGCVFFFSSYCLYTAFYSIVISQIPLNEFLLTRLTIENQPLSKPCVPCPLNPSRCNYAG